MGISISAALKKRNRLVAAYRDIHSAARIYGSTSMEMVERKIAARGLIAGPGKLPHWAIQYADGWWDALSDQAARYHHVYGCFMNGKFYSTHHDRADYYGKHDIEPRDFGEGSAATGCGFYWKEWVNKGEPRAYYIHEEARKGGV